MFYCSAGQPISLHKWKHFFAFKLRGKKERIKQFILTTYSFPGRLCSFFSSTLFYSTVNFQNELPECKVFSNHHPNNYLSNQLQSGISLLTLLKRLFGGPQQTLCCQMEGSCHWRFFLKFWYLIFLKPTPLWFVVHYRFWASFFQSAELQ